MEQDAAVEHPHHRPVVAPREQQVAGDPRGHAHEQHPLHPEPAEEERHREHEPDLGHLPEGHLAGRVHHPDLVEERVGERVVELQGDAQQRGADHEHRERRLAQQAQGVEPEHVPRGDPGRRPLRRRVRQQQAVEPEDDGGGGRDLHRPLGVLEPQEPHREAGHDPADGAQHPDGRELAGRLGHLPERQRVGQGQGRHVAERVEQQHAVDGGERRPRRREEEHRTARDVQARQQLLGREPAVGDHADEERRDHRGDRRRPEHQPDLLPRERQRLAQIGPQRHRPRAPHEELQEHHGRELGADQWSHRSVPRSPHRLAANKDARSRQYVTARA